MRYLRFSVGKEKFFLLSVLWMNVVNCCFKNTFVPILFAIYLQVFAGEAIF
jgi:hypothetical protein